MINGGSEDDMKGARTLVNCHVDLKAFQRTSAGVDYLVFRRMGLRRVVSESRRPHSHIVSLLSRIVLPLRSPHGQAIS